MGDIETLEQLIKGFEEELEQLKQAAERLRILCPALHESRPLVRTSLPRGKGQGQD